MGKASRWFLALLGAKKSLDSSEKKKKWASARSSDSNDRNIGGRKGSYAEASSSALYVETSTDANKHAIAVAVATAAAAEAALAAAHAAAEVVKLTRGGGSRPAAAHGSGNDRRWELAALKIQSAFRTYLARRALRALKGLVRLQALVRGHIVRKQSADMLRRMQAMARIQARASANRSHSRLPHSCKYRNPLQGLASTKKCNSQLRAFGSKSDGSPILKSSQSNKKTSGNVNLGSNLLERWMKESSWNSSQGDGTLLKTGHANDDQRSDKILEVDTWKPHLNPKRSGKIFRTSQHVKGLPLNFPIQEDQEAGGTSEKNSPQVVVYSAASSRPGSRGGPFTPAKSECSRSFFSDYPGYYPNYMANTESSRAKIRSQSAPRTRTQVEKLGSRRMFDHESRDADTVSERTWTLHSNSSTKAYPGSGRLDGPVVPVRGKSTNSNNSSYGTGK